MSVLKAISSGRNKPPKILHVSPHVGGGVGAVLNAFFNQSRLQGIVNGVLCLDTCHASRALVAADYWQDSVWSHPYEKVDLEVEACDIVVFHYWNHPLMAKILQDWNYFHRPSIVWAHNSGLHEPHIIPSYLVDRCDRLIFTSSASLLAYNIQILCTDFEHMDSVVHSCRSLETFLKIDRGRRSESRPFRVVYIGTVAYSKLHYESAAIFTALIRFGLSVRVVGGNCHQDFLKHCDSLGGGVEVIGPTDSVEKHLDWADLFVYPLRSDHYGTGEQVILEALAAGLPVVAFANPAEMAIIRDHVTGRLVESSSEFIDAVIEISINKDLLIHMSRKSRLHVVEHFGAERMTKGLLEIVRHVLGDNRRCRRDFAGDPADKGLYLYVKSSFHDENLQLLVLEDSAAAAQAVFEKIKPHLVSKQNLSFWTGETKSTPRQYLKYFSESDGLRRLCFLIDREVRRKHGFLATVKP